MKIKDKYVVIEDCCMYTPVNKDDVVPRMVSYRFTDKGYSRMISNNGVHAFINGNSRIPMGIDGYDPRIIFIPVSCVNTEEVAVFLDFFSTTVKGFESISAYLDSLPGDEIFLLRHVGEFTEIKGYGKATNI